jgi:predicted secreted acid phosphatase
MRALFRGILALLREIGDENAYARHLIAHGSAHSPEEWRRFCDDRFARKYQRAKCC